MKIAKWLNVRTAALGVGLTALVFAAGCSSQTAEEPVTDSSNALAATSEDYNGDQGGRTDFVEVDPTKVTGFSIASKEVADAPAKVVLNFVWKGQETGYWCGPGSSRIAISTQLPAANLPTQTELATFMGTTTDGTIRANLVDALNHWINPATQYQSIPLDTKPTDDQRALLKATLISRLSAGYPVVANVLSGWRPPGYPSGTIGHFVAVVGYDTTNDTVMIADPAGEGAPSPRWVNVPRSYWISLQNLGTWIGGRGFAG
jgi:hypothetical protein